MTLSFSSWQTQSMSEGGWTMESFASRSLKISTRSGSTLPESCAVTLQWILDITLSTEEDYSRKGFLDAESSVTTSTMYE